MLFRTKFLPNRTHRINSKKIEFNDGIAIVDDDDFTKAELTSLAELFDGSETPVGAPNVAEEVVVHDEGHNDAAPEKMPEKMRETVPASWTIARMYEYADDQDITIPGDLKKKADIADFLCNVGKKANSIPV